MVSGGLYYLFFAFLSPILQTVQEASFFWLSWWSTFFDHLLWSIFQSSITHYIEQLLQVLTCFMVTFCGQLSCTASTPVSLTCGHYQNMSDISTAHPLLGTMTPLWPHYGLFIFFHTHIMCLCKPNFLLKSVGIFLSLSSLVIAFKSHFLFHRFWNRL